MSWQIQAPTVGVADLAGLLTDPRWSVHVSQLPPDVTPPALVVEASTPIHDGRSLCATGQGVLEPRFAVYLYGSTAAQAEWLRDMVLAADWPARWQPDPTGWITATTGDPARPWTIITMVVQHTERAMP